MHGKAKIVLCFLSFTVGAANAIDTDYYWGFLRSHDCTTENAQQDCQRYCKMAPALCHEGECYCHRSFVDFMDHSRAATDMTDYDLQPFVSHIAHFCPNLDKARECIRKCIGTGKPAFCGKDHACYCGHRYSNNDSQNEQDAKEIYKDFEDMYVKYLGVTYPEHEDILPDSMERFHSQGS